MTTNTANTSPHNYDRKPKPDDDEEEDPLDIMLKKTGCQQLHYSVQDCMAEHRDWRACQQQVKQFGDCMKDYERRKSQLNS